MISSYLPASYKETPIYERSCFSTFMMGRVLELSTLLCKAVFEMYDVNRVLLATIDDYEGGEEASCTRRFFSASR